MQPLQPAAHCPQPELVPEPEGECLDPIVRIRNDIADPPGELGPAIQNVFTLIGKLVSPETSQWDEYLQIVVNLLQVGAGLLGSLAFLFGRPPPLLPLPDGGG